jgi:hypothetical protein
MPLPDREQQIVQSHAAFICEVVALLGRADGRTRLAEVLAEAERNGWTALSAAVRRFAEGHRELPPDGALDDEDRIIAAAILRGLQDPATLPDPATRADPTMAAPGLAHMIHEAAHGNAQALALLGQMGEQMSRVGGDMGRLAALLRPMINGERDADRLCARLDTRGRQLVLQILEQLALLERH